MTPRSPDSVSFELDYIVAALEDVSALNDLIGGAADTLMEAPLALVVLAIAAPAHVSSEIESVSGACSETMKALLAMQEPVGRLLALLDGRQKAIRAEAGL